MERIRIIKLYEMKKCETIEEFEIVESVQTKLSPSKISNMRDFLGKR